MDFSKRLLPTDEKSIFSEEGYFVWCGAVFRYDSAYYMIYSRWEKAKGFEAWVTDSELCLAKGETLYGRFAHVRVLFDRAAPDGEHWCFHNPAVLLDGGRIYLYYMMNRGSGDWWQHRNRQRIGFAYAEHPEGVWVRAQEPILDVSDVGIDSLMVSNPTVLKRSDGRVLMVYKAVSKEGTMPMGGRVICGAAEAPSPRGPFRKYGRPLFVNPENAWSVEDPFIWEEGGRFYALAKDFQGYFTGTGRVSTALFCSEDGYAWRPSEVPLAYENRICFADGVREVFRLERPSLILEDGRAVALLCAVKPTEDGEESYNIRIPLAIE